MSAFHKIMNTLLVFPFCCMFVIVPLQWGHAMTKNGYFRTMNLPLTFPTGIYTCIATMGALANDTNVYGCVWNYEETTKSLVQFKTTEEIGNPWFIVIGK